MSYFFMLSKLISPFILPLGFLQVTFWFLFLFRKRIPSLFWIIWGLLFWVVSMPAVANLLLRFWEEPLGVLSSMDSGSHEAIVILGGMVRGKTAEGQWRFNGSVDRLTESLKLYQQKIAPRLLVTGGETGVFDSHGWTEAEIMLDCFSLWGVPAQAILLEDQAQNTYQNAVYSHRVLQQAQADKVLLVTSAFHMKRALAVFQKQGVNVTPYSVDSRSIQTDFILSFFPSLKALSVVELVLHEVVGYIVYAFMGYL